MKQSKFLQFLILFVSINFLLIIRTVTTQPLFRNTIGGSAGLELGYSIARTSDGGFVISGQTSSFGAGLDDGYVIKLDSFENIQWTRTIGGSSDDVARSIVQSTDGGYLITGFTNSFGHGRSDVYAVKLNSSGNIQWTRTIGGINEEYGRSVIQSHDGGFVIAGDTKSFGSGSTDIYIIKLDFNGNLQWSKTAGGPYEDSGYSIVGTSDSGFAVAGYTNSFGAGGYEAYVIKFNYSGNLQWSRTVGGNDVEWALSIVQTTDGGYAVCGSTGSFGTNYYIFKLNPNGQLQWTRSLGGSERDEGYHIIQTMDGGYAVIGWSKSFGDFNGDAYLVKLDNNGNKQWGRAFITPNINDDGFSLIQPSDGGFLMTGTYREGYTTVGDIYIIRTDINGSSCGTVINDTTSTLSGGTQGSGCMISSGGLVSSGGIQGSGGILTNICSSIGIKKIADKIPEFFMLHQNYPNPFNPKTIINFQLPVSNYVSLKVYDIMGREIVVLVHEHLATGTYEVEWDAANFPSGVYYYQFTTNAYSETKKMVLIK